MNDRAARHARHLAVGLSALAVMGGGRVWAQGSSSGSGAPAAAQMVWEPSQLVATLHEVNQMEIAAGHLAEKNGASRAVRDYGHMLVSDHQAADRDITAYAGSKGMGLNDVPPRVAAQQQRARAEMDKLRKMKGPSFDRRFALDMAEAHQKVIALLDAPGTAVSDVALTILLDTLKPTLRKHLAMAQDILNGNPGSASSAGAHGATVQGRRGLIH